MENKCAVCGEDASQRCLHCGVLGYCGKEHEKKDWASHKATCRPYRVDVSETSSGYVYIDRRKNFE